jgi:hypothetical protein
MTCAELEALRLAVMNVYGIADETTRRHAEQELAGERTGPIDALAEADTIAEIHRHLDAALVDLESDVADTPADDPEYDYLRGRLIAVRDATMTVGRIADTGEQLLEDLGTAHHALHETFPADE